MPRNRDHLRFEHGDEVRLIGGPADDTTGADDAVMVDVTVRISKRALRYLGEGIPFPRPLYGATIERLIREEQERLLNQPATPATGGWQPRTMEELTRDAS